MKRIALAAVLLVALVGPARAGFDEGVAAFNLGDFTTALEEFRPLAERGDAMAQSNLGIMYENGQGVPQDYAEALKWFRKAATQDDVNAQYHLGRMYDIGQGVPQDYVQAYMWFILATVQGDWMAREDRDIIAKKMTPAEISKAQAMAREWMEKHQE